MPRYGLSLPTRLGDILELWDEKGVSYDSPSGGCGTTEFEFKNEKERKKATNLFISRIGIYEMNRNGGLTFGTNLLAQLKKENNEKGKEKSSIQRTHRN